MNYLKLMSILSEADADEYGVATQKKKIDEIDDFHLSKADDAFKDMHKVDVATEKDFESLGPITTKQHDDHKGNPSSINIGDATNQSPLKQFDMGGIGKSSYRKIDKTEGQKAMPKVDDGATKVLRMKEEAEELEEFDKQKLKYDPERGYNKHQATVRGSNKSSFSRKTKLPVRKTFKAAAKDIVKQNKMRGNRFDDPLRQSGYDLHSYKESVDLEEGSNFDATKFGMPKPGEKRWKQTSLSPKEAAAKHGKENVRVQKGRLRNGDDMVEVHVESVEEAVGTAAKYAHKKGIFGGKYGAKDHYLNVGYKTALNYSAQRRAQRKAEHEKQDPGMAKRGYEGNMVDARKARKKAKERGVTNIPKMKGVNYREEVEQLDELSPKTLNSYATKAQPDVRRQSLDAAKRKRRAKGVAIARFKALRGSK